MYCTTKERRNALKMEKKATFCFSRIYLISLPEVQKYFQKAQPSFFTCQWKIHFLRSQEFLPSPGKCGRALQNFIPKAKSILAHDLMAYVFCGRNKTENVSERGKKKEEGAWLGLSGELWSRKNQMVPESQPLLLLSGKLVLAWEELWKDKGQRKCLEKISSRTSPRKIF